MKLLSDYVGWHGRIGRGTWLGRLLVVALLAIAFGLFAHALAGEPGAALVAALFVWCAAALAARRLHDTGRSGWAMLAAIVPIAGPLWVLFQLTRPGVEGRNRYGSDPDARFDYLRVDIGRPGPAA